MENSVAGARAYFVRCAKERIFTGLLARQLYKEWLYGGLTVHLARELGKEWKPTYSLRAYVAEDFDCCLKALQSCYDFLAHIAGKKEKAQQLTQCINQILVECGQTLNLTWKKGHFEANVTGSLTN